MMISCRYQSHDEISKTLSEWIGKEILFPQHLTDSVEFPMQSRYKIIIYVDSIGCFSCKLNFREWQAQLDDFENKCNQKVDVLFILQTMRTDKIDYLVKWDGLNYSIYFDEFNYFNGLNKLPENEMFHAFLLDNMNRIVAVGNPISNPQIKDLYLKIIQRDDVNNTTIADNLKRTIVKIDKTTISLGTFNSKEIQKVDFTLTNIGSAPLIIEGLTPSCRCITVDYDKKPIFPGRSSKLEIKYLADYSGFFSRSITLYCNAKGSPFKVEVTGNAK